MSDLMTTHAAVLQALVRGEASGVEIIDRVLVASGERIRLTPATTYRALRTMEADGLVVPVERPPCGRGRPKIHYRLTGLGARQAMGERSALLGLLGSPVARTTG